LQEHGGYLWVIHAENMEDIVIARVRVEELERLGRGNP
jgi:hypothetical protein